MNRVRLSALLVICLCAAVSSCLQSQSVVKVAHLKFTGVKAVDEGQLRSVLATVQSSRIPWGPKHYFTRARFEADLKRIVAFYRDRGYPDAKVASFDVKLSPAQDSVDLRVDVDEGQPVVVEQIEFNGFDVLPPAHFKDLEARVPLQPGKPVDRALAQAMREAALDEIKDHGYPYATVRLTERPGGADRKKILTLQATPGTVARYGPVQIVGNTSVGENVIRRQLTFRPGWLYRLSQVQESQRKLYDLQTFQFANIEPDVKEGEQPTIVPTRVTLTEGKHRKVNFGFGYGSEEKARATIDWRHVNFFGGARTAEVQAKYSSLDRGARVNFRQPYLFSPHIDLLLSGQSWHNDEPAFKLNTNGGRVTVERTLAPRGPFSQRTAVTTLSLTYTDEHESYSVTPAALADPTFRKNLISLGLDPQTGQGSGLLSSLDFDARRSTAGTGIDPKKGYVVSAHLEQAGKYLRGDANYVETILEGRTYFPIGQLGVFAVRARGGSIRPFGDLNSNIPFFKRYFIGGASSLRGWGRFEVSPLAGGLPIGGHTILETSAEARVPVRGNFAVVAFLDAGNVWNDAWSFNLNEMRYDAGPGLRYTTPIGPIRVDLGYQLNPIPGLLIDGKPQTRRFRVHFSIGQAF